MFLAPAKRRFTSSALERISSIFADTAQIALASAVIPAILDTRDAGLLGLGLVATIIFWITSVAVAQQIK